ncbi:helix-turn-helix domain-containing protein [Paracoccus marcusii]|uniref:helix-turn-helix domain-containing protein n=1 Tax=Paracoccus marcusii TaxID=59779 RepID=UPI000A037A3F
MPPLLWTPDEAAAYLKVSQKTLQRLRNRGLPYVMISSGTIRYRPDDLTTFIEDRVQQCPTARKARASGTSTSKSGVVDFTAVAARMTTRKRKQ